MQQDLGLRRLRTGYTTGSCATAAAKAATYMLFQQKFFNKIYISLPEGQKVLFKINHGQLTKDKASCYVIKDAGDDPDITNKAQIWATVNTGKKINNTRQSTYVENLIKIVGGEGIGKVTRPGLAIQQGEWAINPVPYKMIQTEVKAVLTSFNDPCELTVTISIPGGETLAQKTLNSQLGIIGGLSVLGTTGIVYPLSINAWKKTIELAIDVALACSCPILVFSAGRSSEQIAKTVISLPEESFIKVGDYMGYAIETACKKGVNKIVVAGQFAKMMKLAAGFVHTHCKLSQLDMNLLVKWGQELMLAEEILDKISKAHTYREAITYLKDNKKMISFLMQKIVDFFISSYQLYLPGGDDRGGEMKTRLEIFPLLAGYAGEIVYWEQKKRIKSIL